ncbi:dicarboxylate/amino acid:cation symporter [Thiotrichales bacterium 19S9-12]|nr:dicarboxylate/amino acid:cation symporter [Thiotrichales bacterium 19S9-11]MCF6811970.1 dicarboxylate/amino acid:cation symporter [Thiotrichales bacterium 19S9-12]
MQQEKGLTKKILIGILLGLIVGLALHPFAQQSWIHNYLTTGIFDTVGTIFITLMKMLVVPLIFISIVCGASNLSDPKSLGRIGIKTLLLYLLTTAIAITFAITFASLFQIGKGANFQIDISSVNISAPNTVKETILSLFTANPIQSLAQGNMLQIIVFSLVFGIAISLSGQAGVRIKSFFDDINDVIMSLVHIVLRFTPYGVFALIAKLAITTEPEKILHLIGYFLTVLFVLFFHLIITNSFLLAILGKLNPITFFKKMFPVQLFGFSTSSSNATLPVTLETVENHLGVKSRVSGFTIPLGATINMDGTSIMQGVATVFIAHVYNIDLSITAYLIIIATATLSSIGTAGIPSVGLITLTLVLTQVGLPVEGIALIIGIDRILDMVRTAVNITGDAAVTTLVAKSENEFDASVYNTKERLIA